MPTKSSQAEQSKLEVPSNASQDAETKKFEIELDTVQTEIASTVQKVTKSLKPKDLGKLIVRLDGQVQKSNNQIITPRLEALEVQQTDDLQLFELPSNATPRQIKIAFNKKIIDLRKLFDATSDKVVDQGLKNQLISLQDAFTRLKENNYQQTSKVISALENQEKLLITFKQEASVLRPLTSKEEQKITSLQESTTDLTTKAETINNLSLEIKKELDTFIVDPRVDVALTKTQEIVANITPANISKTLPELTSSVTQTNTALQASSQKVIDATNIFVKLGYTSTFDDLEALKKFYRKNSLELHPDKQTDKTDEEKNVNQEKFKKLSDAYEILINPEQIQALTSAIKHQERLLIEFKNKVQQENIPLTEEQKTTIDKLEKESISAEELRMLDMEKRFETAAAESAKSVQEHSANLLNSLIVKINENINSILKPSLKKLSEIINPSIFSARGARRTVNLLSSTEDIVTSEIKNEIINPYLDSIKDLNNEKTIKTMTAKDQQTFNHSYNSYKEKILSALQEEKIKNINNDYISSLIDTVANNLGLTSKPDDAATEYTSWTEPEKKSSKLYSSAN